MARRQAAEHEPLIIDRAAAAEIPSEQAVREWAHGRRGFISSVMAELQSERKAAATAIRNIGAVPIMFETFGGRDADPEDAYLGEVETADIYIGIIGRKYGRPLKSRYSATHTEYLHAEKSGLRIGIWCLDVHALQPLHERARDDPQDRRPGAALVIGLESCGTIPQIPSVHAAARQRWPRSLPCRRQIQKA